MDNFDLDLDALFEQDKNQATNTQAALAQENNFRGSFSLKLDDCIEAAVLKVVGTALARNGAFRADAASDEQANGNYSPAENLHAQDAQGNSASNVTVTVGDEMAMDEIALALDSALTATAADTFADSDVTADMVEVVQSTAQVSDPVADMDTDVLSPTSSDVRLLLDAVLSAELHEKFNAISALGQPSQPSQDEPPLDLPKALEPTQLEAQLDNLAQAEELPAGPSLEHLVSELEMDIASAKPTAASAVSKKQAEQANTAGLRQHIVFTLNDTSYAIPVDHVLEISRPLATTPLPNVPEWVLGIANLRGDVVSMVDLRGFLGLSRPALPGQGRLLLLRSIREDMHVGLIVDRVTEITRLPEHVEMPAGTLNASVAPYMRGVMEHREKVLVMLDAERLLLSPTMRQFELTASL